MNVLKKRSFKYTSLSTVFTAAVLGVVVMLNVIFTVLAARYTLYADLTDTELWTLSDAAKEIISEAEGEITITFCHERDYIESSATMRYISNTALEIEKEFPNVTVRYINSILEPQLVSKYKYTDVSTIKTTNVIVESGSEFRVYAADAFFVTDPTTGSTWAYNGEEIFAAAFLAVTADETPTAYLTLGHGELEENPKKNKEFPTAFVNTIVKAGFDVKTIDLTKEEITDDCRLLIIYDPQYDFSGYDPNNKDAVSEIAKIDRFLEDDGTLMVFKNPNTGYLKNLEEFLYEWGIVFGDGVVVDAANSLTADGRSLVAAYPSGTLAASVHSDISSLPSAPKTIVKNAGPVNVSPLYVAGMDDEGNATNTYIYSGNNAYRELSAVLTAYPSAHLSENGKTIDAAGGYNLMTITRDMNTRDNDTYYSYVMAANTLGFTSNTYLESNAYANENILYYALRVMGREKVPCDIPFKEFAVTKIEDMTSAEAMRAAVLLITVIPICAAVCGVVVTTRRKYR